jgi:hypothetical protein
MNPSLGENCRESQTADLKEWMMQQWKAVPYKTAYQYF